jgi:hypothetical protein
MSEMSATAATMAIRKRALGELGCVRRIPAFSTGGI